MEVIRDSNGNIVQRSRNLRGVRDFVSKNSGYPRFNYPTLISIDKIGKESDTWEAKLCIMFNGGYTFETNFASFSVLKQWIRTWRNVYGTPLLVNGIDAGKVSYKNEYLIGE